MENPDPEPPNLAFKLLLLLALVLVNAFFAMSEIAIISLNDAKLERQAAEGNTAPSLLVTVPASSA